MTEHCCADKLVLIRARVHPFPSRTRKLSSLLPTILGWRRPGKIGSANTKAHDVSRGLLSCLYSTAVRSKRMPTMSSGQLYHGFTYVIRSFAVILFCAFGLVSCFVSALWAGRYDRWYRCKKDRFSYRIWRKVGYHCGFYFSIRGMYEAFARYGNSNMAMVLDRGDCSYKTVQRDIGLSS